MEVSDNCSSPAPRVCAWHWAEHLIVLAPGHSSQRPRDMAATLCPFCGCMTWRGEGGKLPQHHTGRTHASSLGVWGHRFHGCIPTPGRVPSHPRPRSSTHWSW